ncbi:MULTISPECIES: thiamine phosphate synthase [Bacteroides]|uniref:Thiamine-phosphate synthase n=2 Tax=Bacteroides TaxID=816 RepID=A0A9X2SWR0_9BACE|nr:MULTISPECIES: thiamine phosphate synthase [Bacteroides]MCR6505597.1 thiamine phosphate synthase [Bacteroides muris (ex Fokt et al. 2023)]MCR6509476.1 thiamine phosphate synthase [Bacteroides muris (ex Fokt et al. 2023)]NVK95106.1 thiamine phosphate synthase [Bacteroides sp. L10-4]TGY02264.1 thiamine phosphate synthase [Bacteroides muris (ex Afrizal et al. 2022)]
MKDEKLKNGGIQFITHYTERYSYSDAARIALEGGCRWVQLRMKDTPVEVIKPVALEVQALCRQYGATFIVDDHVELAKELHADGVHLGKKDMPIADARLMLGEEYIIGGTANTFEDVLQHYKDGADYIGCGPFRYTATKKNLSPILGLEGYTTIIRRMQEKNIHLPIVAIGGITIADIPAIMQTGVSGIALSGTVLHADSPADEMKRIMNL